MRPDNFAGPRLVRRPAPAEDPHAHLGALHETIDAAARAAWNDSYRTGATPLAPLVRVHRALDTLRRFTLSESVAAAAADIERDVLDDLEQLAWLHHLPSERTLTDIERAELRRAQEAVRSFMWVLAHGQAERRATRRAGRL